MGESCCEAETSFGNEKTMTYFVQSDTPYDLLMREWLARNDRAPIQSMAVPIEGEPEKRKRVIMWEEIESPQDREVREALVAHTKKVTELIPTLKPGEQLCNHLDPHIIPVVEGEELKFREWMIKMGWFHSNGYCPVYYPMWLRHAYRVATGGKLPVWEDEPAAFGEGGKWIPNWEEKK